MCKMKLNLKLYTSNKFNRKEILMPLVNTNKMFADAYERRYAVGAFNVDSIAMIQAVLQAAEDCKSPVMISL